jgi:hypothetical protein
MADGSRTSALEAEAESAAAEAASEAKAEVLARAGSEATKTAPEKKGRLARAFSGKNQWHDFVVDVWITNFNSIEFGIYKHSRNRAKSRQFTSDMDIYAEILENGERTGLLGYREDLWRKNLGMDKRLVFKLFGERLNGSAPRLRITAIDAVSASHSVRLPSAFVTSSKIWPCGLRHEIVLMTPVSSSVCRESKMPTWLWCAIARPDRPAMPAAASTLATRIERDMENPLDLASTAPRRGTSRPADSKPPRARKP